MRLQSLNPYIQNQSSKGGTLSNIGLIANKYASNVCIFSHFLNILDTSIYLLIPFFVLGLARSL